MLAGLELFRALGGPARLPTLIAYLYVCENEGLCVSELAAVAGLSLAGASRAARDLTETTKGEGGEGRPALARFVRSGTIKALYLTASGRSLRDGIDHHLRRAATIST